MGVRVGGGGRETVSLGLGSGGGDSEIGEGIERSGRAMEIFVVC